VEAVVVDGREADDGDVVARIGVRARRQVAAADVAQRLRRALEREGIVRRRAEVEAQPPVGGADDLLAEGPRARLEAAREEVVEGAVGGERLFGLVGAAAGDGGERADGAAREARVVVRAHERGEELGAEEDGPERAAERGFVGEAQRAVAHDGLGDFFARDAIDVVNRLHNV